MLTSVDAELMRVLADPLRMRIVTLLAEEALCTTHLVEETGARQTNLSNHLRILRDAGLVGTEPCGRFTYYSLRPDALEAVAAEFAGLAATARRPARPCTRSTLLSAIEAGSDTTDPLTVEPPPASGRERPHAVPLANRVAAE